MENSIRTDFDQLGRKPIQFYIAAGKRLKQAKELAESGTQAKTFAEMVEELPVSRRQADYLVSIYDHRSEILAAGIKTYSAALRFISDLRRRRRDHEA